MCRPRDHHHRRRHPPCVCKSCSLPRPCVLKANVRLLMEAQLQRKQMSGVRQREGHAQFHRRKPLRASPQSDPPSARVFSPSLFSPRASAINSKLFGFPVFTLGCFHYANTKKLVAALMFFSTFCFFFFRWGNGIEEAHLPSCSRHL